LKVAEIKSTQISYLVCKKCLPRDSSLHKKKIIEKNTFGITIVV